MNVERQVVCWWQAAAEDLEAAQLLAGRSKVNQALFFAHLALEKSLKAMVCRHTADTPPFIHDLTQLAGLSGVSFVDEQRKLLARVSTFNLQGRYQIPAKPLMSGSEAQDLVGKVQDLIQWLNSL